MKSRFGIVDPKCEPAYGIKEKMKFSDKECWLNLKIHLDSDVNGEKMVEKFQNFKIFQILDKYVQVCNIKNPQA